MTTRVLFAVVALSCSSAPPEPRLCHLLVGDGFSDAQRGAIFDASLEWYTRSGGLVSFDAPATDAFSTDVIRFDPATSTQLTAEFGGGTIGLESNHERSSHIQIAQGLDDQTFHQTALHELGHALGLGHLTPGNIMCADTQCATLDVRCGDLQALAKHPVQGCIL
jgi:hypothetical protein